MSVALADLIQHTTAAAPRRPTGKPPEDWRGQAEQLAAAWTAAGYDDRHGLLIPLAGWLVTAIAGGATRGLIIYGNPGTGKSSAMRMLAAGLSAAGDARYRVYDAPSIERQYRGIDKAAARDARIVNLGTYAGFGSICGDFHRRRVLFLDDVGREPETVLFSHRSRPIGDILTLRDRAYTQFGALTVVSSNCTENELVDLYGVAVRDRIAGMFMAVQAAGESSRSKKVWRP